MATLPVSALLCTMLLVADAAPTRAETVITVKTPSVVMFAPPPAEIDQLTDRDISIQDFLAYWIDIQRRLRGELSGVAVLETDANEIVLPDRTVVRSRTPHGYGFVFFAPGRGSRLIDGVLTPDECEKAARAYFEAATPSSPSSTADKVAPSTLGDGRPTARIAERDSPARVAAAGLPTAAQPPSTVAWFAGTWRGNVKQFLAPAYTVTMELTPGDIGSTSGSISYPEFKCTGHLMLLEQGSDHIRLSEKIDTGKCVDSGSIVLSTADNRDGNNWEWYDYRGRRRATARLARATPATMPLGPHGALPHDENPLSPGGKANLDGEAIAASSNSSPQEARRDVSRSLQKPTRQPLTRSQLQEQFGRKTFQTKIAIGNALVNNDHNFRSSSGQYVTGVSRGLVDTNVYPDGGVFYNLTSTTFGVFITAYDVSPLCGPNRSDAWVPGDWGNALQNVSLCEIKTGSDVSIVRLALKSDRLDLELSAQGVYAKLKVLLGKDWQKTMDLDGVKDALSRVLTIR
jgi:hypothetical protein